MTYSKANEHLTKEECHKQGAFFTPKDLAIHMVKYMDIKSDYSDLVILDPCVGRANLFKAVKELYPDIPNKCFYGVDIDKEAIRLNLQDPELQGMNFQVGNCLTDDISNDDFWVKKWDEPFAKNIKQEIKNIKRSKQKVVKISIGKLSAKFESFEQAHQNLKAGDKVKSTIYLINGEQKIKEYKAAKDNPVRVPNDIIKGINKDEILKVVCERI